jgi:hypothetical protein
MLLDEGSPCKNNAFLNIMLLKGWYVLFYQKIRHGGRIFLSYEFKLAFDINNYGQII